MHVLVPMKRPGEGGRWIYQNNPIATVKITNSKYAKSNRNHISRQEWCSRCVLVIVFHIFVVPIKIMNSVRFARRVKNINCTLPSRQCLIVRWALAFIYTLSERWLHQENYTACHFVATKWHGQWQVHAPKPLNRVTSYECYGVHG